MVFYDAVLGWEFDDGAATLGGAPVARYGQPVQASGSLTVLSSTGLEADLDASIAAGGSVLEEPGAGGGARVAVPRDQAGAEIVLHEVSH